MNHCVLLGFYLWLPLINSDNRNLYKHINMIGCNIKSIIYYFWANSNGFPVTLELGLYWTTSQHAVYVHFQHPVPVVFVLYVVINFVVLLLLGILVIHNLCMMTMKVFRKYCLILNRSLKKCPILHFLSGQRVGLKTWWTPTVVSWFPLKSLFTELLSLRFFYIY